MSASVDVVGNGLRMCRESCHCGCEEEKRKEEEEDEKQEKNEKKRNVFSTKNRVEKPKFEINNFEKNLLMNKTCTRI